MNTNVVPIWAFIGLAVLALLIAGVVVLFVKLRAKAWWVVGPVLGVGLLVVVPAVLGLHFLDLPIAMPARQVNIHAPTPVRPRSVSVSDVADGNSVRGIVSKQTYYNEDGSPQPRASKQTYYNVDGLPQPRASKQTYYNVDGSAYAEPSGGAAAVATRGERGRAGPQRGMSVGVGVVELVLVALLIAGVVVLFVKLRAKAWWIVGPVLGLVVLGAGLLWTLASHPVSAERAKLDQVTYSRTRTAGGGSDPIAVVRSGGAPVPVRAVSPDVVSADRLSETFLADVYPSALQAAEALAAHVARSFHSSPDQSPGTMGSAEPPSPAGPAEAAALPDVMVNGRADAMILQAVADALRKNLVARSVKVTTTPAAGNGIVCTVYVVGGAGSGTVSVVLHSPPKQVSRTARFDDKPWAANFAQYVAVAGKPVVRAMSTPAASFEEAQDEALADAARKLTPYVNSAMKPMMPAVGGEVGALAMHDAILTELRRGKLVKDRFSQQFDRPYGKLWRVQILVDASPNAIDPIAFEVANTAADTRRIDRQTWWTLTVSLGGLAVLIFAVYLVLNAATKGYYTWVLRLLAIGAIIAGVALAMA